MSRNSQDNLAVLILVVFCLVLYANSLGNSLTLDDFHTIRDNLYIKNLRYIPLLFKGDYSSDPVPKGMFRPLLLLTFSFNYIFGRTQPLGYHIINLLLHFLSGIVFYSLLRLLKKDMPFGLSLAVSLLFIAHPINTEAVNYITCRSDLFVAFFILLAFTSFVKARFVLSIFLYAMSLLTKETALVFFPLIFTYDFLRPLSLVSKDSRGATSKRNKYIFYIAVIALSVSYWAYRMIMFGAKASILSSLSSPVRSFSSNILTQAWVTVFYLRQFFWPDCLNIDHTLPQINSLLDPTALIPVVIISIMVIFVFRIRKRFPLASLGLAWYLICLLPKFYAVLNFPAMEHHFYMPGIGIYFIIAQVLETAYVRFRRRFIYAACGVLSVFTVLVWFRNYEWKNSFNLYKSAAQKNPGSAVAHNNLGLEYMHMGLYDAAEKEFKISMQFSEGSGGSLNPMGNLIAIYRRQKRYNDALKLAKEMFLIAPKNSFAYVSLGVIYLDMGEKEKAERAWKKALSLDPLSPKSHLHLGVFYMQEKKFEDSEYHFREAIKNNPDSYLGYLYLGLIFEQGNDIDAAIRAYEKSLELNPDFAFTHYYLGKIYAKKSDGRSLAHLTRAIELSPNLAEAHNDLAVLYASMQPPRLELARQHARKALFLDYKVEEGFLRVIGLR